jgi:sulfatase modifying factor 1
MKFRRSALALPALVIGSMLAASCLFPSLDDLTRCPSGCGGSKGTGTATAAATGAGGGSAAACPSKHGPTGVLVEPGNGFPSFCIDATEVSVADYRAFYTGNYFPLADALIPAPCKWKTPAQKPYQPLDYIWQYFSPQDKESRPIQGVDWCDAATYCAWAGKRLCGSDDPMNRHIVAQGTNWSHAGEWFRACEGPKGTPYPYGGTYSPTACNTMKGSGQDPFQTKDVTQPSTCIAVWPKGNVFDMLGNVSEFEDDCLDGSGATPDKDVCFPRGGAYPLSGDYNTCDYYQTNITALRGVKGDYIGFRCCW